MSVLTTSQLTFCDLNEFCNVHLDTECIGVACDKNGAVIAEQTATIHYGGFMGSTRVGLSYEINMLPNGITLIEENSTSASGTQDGTIELRIAQGSTLGNVSSVGAKITFKTSDNFTFEKYITFVKYMVGADGQAGTDAISFEIYSTDGFEFSDEITEINLKTIAYCGATPLESNVTYQWFLYTPDNDEDGDEADWTEISGEIGPSLHVKKNEFDVFPVTLKCIMDNKYEAYINLTDRIMTYTSVVKFFNDSNIFSASDEYIIAYVELYKNNQLIEGLSTPNYFFSETNRLENGVFTGDVPLNDDETTYSDGDQWYFIYKSDDRKYDIGLGEYNAAQDQWNLVNTIYSYENNIVENDQSNVLLILKNDINKYQNIVFNVHEKIDADNSGPIISSTSAMVFDINDPIVSPGEPENVKFGQLWLDTSDTPYVLKIYTEIDGGGEWKYFEQQKGKRVFTSEPDLTDVAEGDFWILGLDDEYVYEYEDKDGNTQSIIYKEGSMLKAASINIENGEYVVVWIDATPSTTETITNVKESFTWDNTGIQIAKKKKIIGSNGTSITQTPFYVHIDSERMGFHSVNYNENGTQDDVEVVHIGNKSATIQNATFEGEDGTTFNNNAQFNQQVSFGKFIWILEGNGSLSLDISNTESAQEV